MEDEVEQLITVEDVASILGVSTQWVYRTIHLEGGLPYLKVGHFIRFRRSDVEAWLERNSRGG